MHRALEAAGRYREALAAIEHAGGDPYRDVVVDELATDRGRLLWRNARFDEAERVLEAAYADRCRRLGEDHPDTLETLERLAANAHYQLRDERAVERFVAVIERLEGTLGSRHLRSGIAKRNYAACLRDQSAFEHATTVLDSAASTIARHCKRDSPEAVATLKVEALLMALQGEAFRLCRTVVDLASSVHGADHVLTAGAMLTLALAQVTIGLDRDAIAVCQRAAEMFETGYGHNHPLVGLALERQAMALATRDDVDGALALMRAADRVYRVAYPGVLLHNWGHVLNALFEADRIDDVLSETAALLERPLDADARDYLQSFRNAALGR